MVALSTRVAADARSSDAASSDVVAHKSAGGDSIQTELNLDNLLDTKLWNLPGWNNNECVF